MTHRITVGEQVPKRPVVSLHGQQLTVPVAGRRFTHLQFRRFAGCPICNHHLRSVAERIGELDDAGIAEVAVFHSQPATMLPFQGALPFVVVADPDRVLYEAFDVGTSLLAFMHPGSWQSAILGMVEARGKGAMTGEGGHLGLPADFLISAEGVVVAAKYGTHADDQWHVDEVLAFAAA